MLGLGLGYFVEQEFDCEWCIRAGEKGVSSHQNRCCQVEKARKSGSTC